MHSFLIIGQDTSLKRHIDNLCKKLNVHQHNYSLDGIEDVRSLKSLVKLKFPSPTAIIIKNVDKLSTEASNALLKSLEEPQKNIYYIITTKSEHQILPTIFSRCQIIRTNNLTRIIESDTKKFVKITKHKQIELCQKIKDRGEAIEFVENLIYYHHNLLLKLNNKKNISILKNIDTLEKSRQALKASGNIGLQLTNLIISLV